MSIRNTISALAAVGISLWLVGCHPLQGPLAPDVWDTTDDIQDAHDGQDPADVRSDQIDSFGDSNDSSLPAPISKIWSRKIDGSNINFVDLVGDLDKITLVGQCDPTGKFSNYSNYFDTGCFVTVARNSDLPIFAPIAIPFPKDGHTSLAHVEALADGSLIACGQKEAGYDGDFLSTAVFAKLPQAASALSWEDPTIEGPQDNYSWNWLSCSVQHGIPLFWSKHELWTPKDLAAAKGTWPPVLAPHPQAAPGDVQAVCASASGELLMLRTMEDVTCGQQYCSLKPIWIGIGNLAKTDFGFADSGVSAFRNYLTCAATADGWAFAYDTKSEDPHLSTTMLRFITPNGQLVSEHRVNMNAVDTIEFVPDAGGVWLSGNSYDGSDLGGPAGGGFFQHIASNSGNGKGFAGSQVPHDGPGYLSYWKVRPYGDMLLYFAAWAGEPAGVYVVGVMDQWGNMSPDRSQGCETTTLAACSDGKHCANCEYGKCQYLPNVPASELKCNTDEPLELGCGNDTGCNLP